MFSSRWLISIEIALLSSFPFLVRGSLCFFSLSGLSSEFLLKLNSFLRFSFLVGDSVRSVELMFSSLLRKTKRGTFLLLMARANGHSSGYNKTLCLCSSGKIKKLGFVKKSLSLIYHISTFY